MGTIWTLRDTTMGTRWDRTIWTLRDITMGARWDKKWEQFEH
jgi:hypothetical protein